MSSTIVVTNRVDNQTCKTASKSSRKNSKLHVDNICISWIGWIVFLVLLFSLMPVLIDRSCDQSIPALTILSFWKCKTKLLNVLFYFTDDGRLFEGIWLLFLTGCGIVYRLAGSQYISQSSIDSIYIQTYLIVEGICGKEIPRKK